MLFLSENVRSCDLSNTVEYFWRKKASKVWNDRRVRKLKRDTHAIMVGIIDVVYRDSFCEDNFSLLDDSLRCENVVDPFGIRIVRFSF